MAKLLHIQYFLSFSSNKGMAKPGFPQWNGHIINLRFGENKRSILFIGPIHVIRSICMYIYIYYFYRIVCIYIYISMLHIGLSENRVHPKSAIDHHVSNSKIHMVIPPYPIILTNWIQVSPYFADFCGLHITILRMVITPAWFASISTRLIAPATPSLMPLRFNVWIWTKPLKNVYVYSDSDM